MQRNAYGGLIRAPLINFLLGRPKSTAGFVARFFNTRAAAPGTAFNYSSIDTEVLGLVLRSAVKMPLADYLSQRVWQPIGAESDASWVIDAWGQEHAYDFFNAVLRDYARFGRLLAHDGWWEGRQIIPREWMLDATTAAPADSYLTPGGLSPGMPLATDISSGPCQARSACSRSSESLDK